MEHFYITRSAEETEHLGQSLARELAPGAVVALFGGLGAGKTAFVRGLARGLRVSGDVCSPTYALVHEYEGLIHFDMYRVESPEDLASTGWYDYLGRDCVIAVEWSEHIESELPEDCIRVHISPGNTENERKIAILCSPLESTPPPP